jgi:DNA-binding PadR family transcriptional regulator
MHSQLRPSPLGLAILGLLQVGPLHPYGIQRLIKLWGKDQVVNVGQRANLYRVINRLHEAGLIVVRQIERDQQFPERTVYELTDEGRITAREWLTSMLSATRYEFPEFPAALSFIMGLTPEESLAVLGQRAEALLDRVSQLDSELADLSDTLPRVTLLESEYLRAVTDAELKWVNSVIDELRAGSLTWSYEDFESVIASDQASLEAIDSASKASPALDGDASQCRPDLNVAESTNTESLHGVRSRLDRVRGYPDQQ